MNMFTVMNQIQELEQQTADSLTPVAVIGIIVIAFFIVRWCVNQK